MKTRTALFALAASCAAMLPFAVAALPPAEAWEIGPIIRGQNYSVGMPVRPTRGPGGSLVMDFPTAGAGEVDAMTTGIPPLEGARQITIRYRVDASARTRFVAVEMPNEAATVSLYFQRAGDNWSARGPYESYRWYAPARAVVPLTRGEHTVTVRLDEGWTNVNGKASHLAPREFAEALRNTARLGLAFGSGSRRSHGVYATGPARFTLLSLEID